MGVRLPLSPPLDFPRIGVASCPCAFPPVPMSSHLSSQIPVEFIYHTYLSSLPSEKVRLSRDQSLPQSLVVGPPGQGWQSPIHG